MRECADWMDRKFAREFCRYLRDCFHPAISMIGVAPIYLIIRWNISVYLQRSSSWLVELILVARDQLLMISGWMIPLLFGRSAFIPDDHGSDRSARLTNRLINSRGRDARFMWYVACSPCVCVRSLARVGIVATGLSYDMYRLRFLIHNPRTCVTVVIILVVANDVVSRSRIPRCARVYLR